MHAQVWDNDGEFLLIEAAYALPRWLKPESAVNRVWLRGGQLQLVPLPSAKHPSLPPLPTVEQALQVGLGALRCLRLPGQCLDEATLTHAAHLPPTLP